MNKFLIINADDLGLSSGVNHGIIESHLEGIVTSASLMVNTPGFVEAIELVSITPSLGVGFHFNLTYGRPISTNVPSLVNNNNQFSTLKLGTSPKWSQEDIQKELTAQWKCIKESGLHITHIDTHHYIQRFPKVYIPLSKLAKHHNLPMRHTFAIETSKSVHSAFTGFHSCLSSLPREHPKTTDRFIGDEYFKDDGFERFNQHLNNIQVGNTEMNCHPGYVDNDLKQLSGWLIERENELALFKQRKLRMESKKKYTVD